MPGKSRRARRFTQQKKQETRPAPVAQQSAAAAPAPRSALKTGTSKQAVPHYPYIGVELVRIGVLTGVIIIILVVLSTVLPRA